MSGAQWSPGLHHFCLLLWIEIFHRIHETWNYFNTDQSFIVSAAFGLVLIAWYLERWIIPCPIGFLCALLFRLHLRFVFLPQHNFIVHSQRHLSANFGCGSRWEIGWWCSLMLVPWDVFFLCTANKRGYELLLQFWTAIHKPNGGNRMSQHLCQPVFHLVTHPVGHNVRSSY